jgi:hypothetical protein
MEETGRETDRTAEMNNMKSFCSEIASSLGYAYNQKTHSSNEFTTKMAEQDIANLHVQEGDIVVFYYDGHGCNWDDDEWPHMALLDSQYWESTAYMKLKEVSKKAKLVLCIASCCNMDSEGSKKAGNAIFELMDANKVKELFTEFSGQLAIKVSASIRGQYSWSWTKGSNPGSIFSISFRESLRKAVATSANIPLTWETILDMTKTQTLAYTDNQQLPQYLIEKFESAVRKPQIKQVRQVQQQTSTQGEATIHEIRIEHNKILNGTKYMAIHVRFETHFLAEQGGQLVAFFEMPKGTGVLDKNGKYRTASGKVSVGLDFGSHYIHSSYADKVLMIPNYEIHPVVGENIYYVQVGVYDNLQKKYIAFSDYATFTMTGK